MHKPPARIVTIAAVFAVMAAALLAVWQGAPAKSPAEQPALAERPALDQPVQVVTAPAAAE